MSSLPSSPWPPPFTPPSGDPIQPLAASIPPPSTTNSVSPSLLIIGVIILFVILASISIHLLLRLLSSRSAPSASSRVFSTSSLSSSSDGPLHFTAQPETNQESSNNNKTDALIEALPLFTLASSLAALPKSSPDCAVCLCPFDPTAELRLLPACRHAFHSQCIDTWLRSTPSCPLCRASVRLPFPPLPSAGGGGHGRTDSFRVEIGSISRRRSDENPNSASGRSYSIGSFDYRIEDEIEAVVSRIALLKEEKEGETTIVGAPPPPGEHVAEVAGGEARGWLRDYVDRLASSASSSFNSLRFSGRWSARSSNRPENAATAGADSRRWDVEAASLAGEGEEEAFYAVYRWIVGV